MVCKPEYKYNSNNYNKIPKLYNNCFFKAETFYHFNFVSTPYKKNNISFFVQISYFCSFSETLIQHIWMSKKLLLSIFKYNKFEIKSRCKYLIGKIRQSNLLAKILFVLYRYLKIVYNDFDLISNRLVQAQIPTVRFIPSPF